MITILISALILIHILVTLLIKSPIVVTIPKFWFDGITLGWLIIIRREKYNDQILAHEFIHYKQQKETFVIFGYLIYILEFLIKSFYYRSFNMGYLSISMEREARLMSGTPEYVFKRRPFMFRHYMRLPDIIRITQNSSTADIRKLLQQGKGQVFKSAIASPYITNKINQFTRTKHGKFEFRAVKKGSELYKIYGDETFIIVTNTTVYAKNKNLN